MCQVPDYLIKCINEGKATLATSALGGGAGYSIPVPENKYIIIYGFRFIHFFVLGFAPKPSINDYSGQVNKAVQFKSKQKQFRYNFRTNFISQVADATLEVSPTINSQPEQIQTYQIHEDDVYITILAHPPVQTWSRTIGVFPNVQTNFPPPPFGFGQQPGGIPVVLRIAESFGTDPEWRTNPMGSKYDQNFGNTNDLFPPVRLGVSTFPTWPPKNNIMNQYSFPMLDVYYCIFDKNPTSKQRP